MVGGLDGRLIGWLDIWLNDLMVLCWDGGMIGRLNGWMIGWFDGRMDGYLAWMVGYLVE